MPLVEFLRETRTSTSSRIRFRSRSQTYFATSRKAHSTPLPAAPSSASRKVVCRRSETTPSRVLEATSSSLGCYGLNRFGMMEADPLIVQAQTKLAGSAVNTSCDGRQLEAAPQVRDDRGGPSIASTPSSLTTARSRGAGGVSRRGHQVIIAKVTPEDEMQKIA